MVPPKNGKNPEVPPPWQPRFGTRALLLFSLVISIMGAGGYYLMRALESHQRYFQLVFILFTLAAPLLVMVIVSIFVAVVYRPRK